MKMVLYKTVKHFFPEFRIWLKKIKDPRNQNSITYFLPAMFWIGNLLFLLKLGARRQINFQLNSEAMVKNINILAKDNIDKIPHDGTLEYLLERLNPVELCKLRTKMINKLIRSKCLSKYRLFGYCLIAIDGSGYLTFNYPHCEHCLKMKKDGKVIYYYHSVLEAKLITDDGMVFNIETEFIENPGSSVKVQDCELNAFHRLVKRLKNSFPQLNICLLLDGLYANRGVFDICEKNRWKYITTFKEGSMPEVYREYETLKRLEGKSGEYESGKIKQKYYWVKDVLYYKPETSSVVNVLECIESKPEEDKKFVWATNFDINETNFHEIGEGGRLRWKIENEGFNIQKNGGYNLEHHYSEDNNAIKNFYLLLQIAHMLSQLMEKGSLLIEEVKKGFGSIKNFTRKLLESFRTSVFDPAEIQAITTSKFQIRLRSP